MGNAKPVAPTAAELDSATWVNTGWPTRDARPATRSAPAARAASGESAPSVSTTSGLDSSADPVSVQGTSPRLA